MEPRPTFEGVGLGVRIWHSPAGYQVQVRHPVFLDWSTVATFAMAGPVPYHHAKTYAQALANRTTD